MDKKLLVLILTAFLCGSIKNSLNQPDVFEGRLAKETDNRRHVFNIPQPHYLKKYKNIVSGVKDNPRSYFKGKILTIEIRMAFNQYTLVSTCYINSITLSSYLIADDNYNPIDQTNPSGNVSPKNDEGKKCPFCREDFISQQLFDDHVLTVHSIDHEGLEQLQSMMKGRKWLVENQLMHIAEKEGDFPRATKGT